MHVHIFTWYENSTHICAYACIYSTSSHVFQCGNFATFRKQITSYTQHNSCSIRTYQQIQQYDKNEHNYGPIGVVVRISSHFMHPESVSLHNQPTKLVENLVHGMWLLVDKIPIQQKFRSKTEILGAIRFMVNTSPPSGTHMICIIYTVSHQKISEEHCAWHILTQ